MANDPRFLRYASPNERRTISREDLGFYHAVIASAVYDFKDADPRSPNAFFYPLKKCIEEHPYLCVTVGDMHTNRSYFQHVAEIDLNRHISFLEPTTHDDEWKDVKDILGKQLDKPFPRDIPPWRVVVLPLQRYYFIAFAFSHTIGDGLIGPAFHSTFLKAFRNRPTDAHLQLATVKTPIRPLPAPFDTAERLPISWSFLLGPLIAIMIPSVIAKWLGVRVAVSNVDSGTWTGSNVVFDSKGLHSKIVLHEINPSVVAKVLNAARNRDAKLTGTFHQLIARSLSNAIPNPDITNFVSITAINMRNCLGVPQREMGEFVSGCYLRHPRRNPTEGFNGAYWDTASSDTKALNHAASDLQDQPLGLLRYLPNMRKWMTDKIGKRRDSSWELSNIGRFEDDDPAQGETKAEIKKMIFAQPGHVDASPLAFNLAGMKEGSVIYTVTWQARSLGVPEEDEERLVNEICSNINHDLETLG